MAPHRNVELKARDADPEKTLAAALAHGAEDQVTAMHRLENLHRALFAKLLQALVQLLDLERIQDAHRAEKIRREVRNAGELKHLAFGKAVADLHVAMVGQADDVTGVCLFHLLARRGHEGLALPFPPLARRLTMR